MLPTYLMLLSCLIMLLLRPLIRGQTHQLLLVNAVQPTSRTTRAVSDVGLPGIAYEKEGRLVFSISLGTRLVTTKLPLTACKVEAESF